MEKHLRIAIKDQQGRIFKLTYRTPLNSSYLPHSHCNVTSATKLGDNVFWHECDMNMTRRQGTVIELVSLVWDYSKPVGKRAIY